MPGASIFSDLLITIQQQNLCCFFDLLITVQRQNLKDTVKLEAKKMKPSYWHGRSAAPNWWPLFHSAPSCPGSLTQKSWTRLAQGRVTSGHWPGMESLALPRPCVPDMDSAPSSSGLPYQTLPECQCNSTQTSRLHTAPPMAMDRVAVDRRRWGPEGDTAGDSDGAECAGHSMVPPYPCTAI